VADAELAPLMLALWRGGWDTVRSCQEHTTGKVWLAFPAARYAEVFLDVVAAHAPEHSDLWLRAKAWGFGPCGERSEPLEDGVSPADAWEYHVTVVDGSYDAMTGRFIDTRPNFQLGISVLFPRNDLPEVLARLEAALSQGARVVRRAP
jgi:hypothetical protein